MYVTVWSRAMTSNFARLLVACAAGAILGGIGVCCAPNIITDDVAAAEIAGATLVYFLVSFLLLSAARLARPVVRDVFYALDCARLKGRKDVSRVLVYGGGLRYRFFRRELVRTTAANERIIVGILDDDILLHGKYIGGIQVLGSIQDAPALINRVNADAVVIACEQTAEQAARVKALLAPTGVSVSLFALSERPL
jgi:FlaA1/EpsC-like NDP-sugar epimerase